VGHADIWEIARKITASLSVPLAEGLPPNTDATWIVDSENKVVAFVGNGRKQTANADAIIAAVARLAEPDPSTEPYPELAEAWRAVDAANEADA
jgi:hypothetical protein